MRPTRFASINRIASVNRKIGNTVDATANNATRPYVEAVCISRSNGRVATNCANANADANVNAAAANRIDPTRAIICPLRIRYTAYVNAAANTNPDPFHTASAAPLSRTSFTNASTIPAPVNPSDATSRPVTGFRKNHADNNNTIAGYVNSRIRSSAAEMYCSPEKSRKLEK